MLSAKQVAVRMGGSGANRRRARGRAVPAPRVQAAVEAGNAVAGECMKTSFAVTRARGRARDQGKPNSGDVLLALDAPGEDEINATIARDP
jgi:hypothetical protein